MKLGIGISCLRAAVVVVAAAFAVTALDGCCPSCPCGVIHPEEPSDGDAAKAPCAAAAARMDALHCKEARPDFVAWCAYSIQQGLPLRPTCISRVPTCAEVDACR